MSITFVFIILVMVIVSLIKPHQKSSPLVEMDRSMFKVNNGFLIGSVIIVGILIGLYAVFW